MISELHSVLQLLEGGFRRVRVLVVGDLMLDRYVQGEVERISPEAPVPVLRHATRYERPGGAANVAMNLAGLGCETYLCGFWGGDGERADLERLVLAAGIETAGVVSSSLPTISKTRIMARTQQLLRLDIESRALPPEEETARLEARALALVKKVHVVVLSDYAKGALTAATCAALIGQARAQGIPVLADPKGRDLSKYTGATTVCPNLQELGLMTGVPAHEQERMLEVARVQMEEHDIGFLTVTMGDKGIRMLGPEGDLHVPARAREVYDVSGAGDTVIAMLAASLAGGLQMRTALELANVAAGIVVGKVGTVPISASELTELLTPERGLGSEEKVLGWEAAVRRAREWRSAGETVVFTNGCFDLLHVGHIQLLEGCRRLGSKVMLGLNSDASVARLKGAERPVVGERERARMAAALASVDAVVVFEEDTPLELILALRPEVLVKGGDYTVETVVGSTEVLGWGGSVEIVPTVEGYSTTALVETLMHAKTAGEAVRGDRGEERFEGE